MVVAGQPQGRRTAGVRRGHPAPAPAPAGPQPPGGEPLHAHADRRGPVRGARLAGRELRQRVRGQALPRARRRRTTQARAAPGHPVQ